MAYVEEQWRKQAACRGKSLELFFVKPGGDMSPELTEARKVCSACPVQQECLRFAIDNRIPQGMFGGKTPRQRESIMLDERKARLEARGRSIYDKMYW